MERLGSFRCGMFGEVSCYLALLACTVFDDSYLDRLGRVVETAGRLPREEREAYLAEACAGDEALRAQAEALLADRHGATAFFDELGGSVREAAAARGEALAVGARLGRYRIVRTLGRGGMGAVYLAERTAEGFTQQVALKIVAAGFDRPRLVERFLAERQILARLQHDGIARLLDVGVTEPGGPLGGLPFFALDYVDGLPITVYADRHRLDLAQRLALFEQVVEAVRYAHANLVIHRDLKPSNIFVTEAGGAPHVKLLDFGVAKLFDAEVMSSASPLTLPAPMTPAYASPEQVRGEPTTTATDVYQLGVVLYELLTGSRPVELGTTSAYETGRAILEQSAPHPSTQVDEGAAAARTTSPRHLRRRLRGDLGRIVMKALRKEPRRRYATADAFLDDLQRYRRGLPIGARPDSLRYRTGKFITRYPMQTGLALALVLLLAGSALTATWQARQVRAERDRAEQERDRAEATVAFVQDLFDRADPTEQPRADTLLARHVLDAGARTLTGGASGEGAAPQAPLLVADLAGTIGRAYFGLALYPEARAVLLRADSALRTLGEASAAGVSIDSVQSQRADVLLRLGATELNLGRYAEARDHFRRAYRLRRSVFGEAHPLPFEARIQLADTYRYGDETGGYDSLRIVWKALDHDARVYAEAQRGKAPRAAHYHLYRHLTGFASNLRELDAALYWSARREEQDGPWGSSANEQMWAAWQLGGLALQSGDVAEGLRQHERAHDLARRTLPPDHPLVLFARNNLTASHLHAYAFGEAEAIQREHAPLFDAKGPIEEVSNAFIARSHWGWALYGLGRYAEADTLWRDLMPRMERRWGRANPFTLRAQFFALRTAEALGRRDEAEAGYRALLADYAAHQPRHYGYGEVYVALARRVAERSPVEADSAYARGLRLLRAARPETHWRVQVAESEAAAHAAARGELGALPRLRAAAALLAEQLGETDPRARAAFVRARTAEERVRVAAPEE